MADKTPDSSNSSDSHPWCESPQFIAQRSNTNLEFGLSHAVARDLLIRQGHNRFAEGKKTGVAERIVAQFSDFMIVVLLVAAAISGVVGDAADAVVIIVIVVLNAAIGLIQEYRAERALDSLKALAAPSAKIKREGIVKTILSEEVVAGDVVVIEAGDWVSADARLFEVADLRVDESALTGESVPQSKYVQSISLQQCPLAERGNMLYRGTLITHGRGLAIVTATGMNTEVGRIAAMLDAPMDQKTPLQKRLADFGRRLAIAVLMICGALLAIGVSRGEPPLLMFLTAISLAVAAIPEALPAVVTLVLGFGARNMVKQQALIRHLPAVETLGSVTVICSDKTGTLTQNVMRVEHVMCAGSGLEGLLPQDRARGPWSVLAQAVTLSNDVTLDDKGEAQGDPTEIALYRAASNVGHIKENLSKQMPRLSELPFDADRKRMTTCHRAGNAVIAFTKGAPEKIIAVCKYQLGLDGVEALDAQTLLADAEALAAKGYRVLAFAYRNWSVLPATMHPQHIESDLVFLGLVAMMDPPRDEAEAAVAQCKSAGIRPVMITGDHPATALAIAQRLGIASPQSLVMTGAGLTQLTSTQLAHTVNNYCVFARVSPEQKIAIVNALQACGEFVAMTGDGVNDAPALKRADIGIAMGKQGTDVARNASDMVLLDDNFATIVAAVHEGRRLYDNIRKFIRYAMTGNSGEIWTLVLAPMMGLPIPLLPIHILWVNLVTDGLPGLALAAEKSERNLMQRPPRQPKESVFSHGMWQHILWIGLLIGFISLFIQAWGLNTGRHWQTMVFTVLTFSQLVHVLAIRSDRESLFSIGLFSNPAMIVAVLVTVALQLMVVYVPFFNPLFNTQPLDLEELAVCFVVPLLVLLAVEIEKLMIRRGWVYKEG